MKTKQTVIFLAKHPHERRYLMCWYSIQIPGKRMIHFRDDEFLSEKEVEELHKLHCSIGNPDKLMQACFKILQPVLQTVGEKALEYLAKYPEPYYSENFKFDSEHKLEDMFQEVN